MDTVAFSGPIRRGGYDVGPEFGLGHRDLTPWPENDMANCKKFETHGCPNPATCSEGCIAATGNYTRDYFNYLMSSEEGSNTIVVVP